MVSKSILESAMICSVRAHGVIKCLREKIGWAHVKGFLNTEHMAGCLILRARRHGGMRELVRLSLKAVKSQCPCHSTTN